jgi:formamidopyrimidine-DNA glycosylase
LPELPDVEGFRRVLARHAGARIAEVTVRDRGVLRGVSAAALARVLRGRRFQRPARHGKWLIAPTDAPAIVLFHFGMTGSLSWHKRDEPLHRDDRIVFALEARELRYRDLRKLQGVRLLRNRQALERLLAGLGPDALKVSRAEFERLLAGRGRLKARLADQAVIAGLGNLLIDEICWRARINPWRRANSLSRAERARFYAHMRRVLRASVRVGRVPGYGSWLTGRRDRRDARCPRCRAPLARRKLAGRTTVWCPRCQPSRS